ncbi:unnamed protein product [Paramecium pentaurelia]|uniref:Uncharacterized protein n=1 Tax=Paramecium pentaurelia TaxID=43138 RepID=A0A8S1YLC5_9CILI|nr:unnamed protein product [Paramecium pentaurelia]
MIRQQSIISAEYLVFDTIDLIKKGQYKQCVAKINRLVFDPQFVKGQPQFLQLQIQLCRRLLYCCNKILKKYFLKYSDKSHKIQPLLNRSIELSFHYIELLETYQKENSKFDGSPLASPSPTIKKKQLFKELYTEQLSLAHKMEMFFSSDIVNNYVQKSNIWFQDHCHNCYIQLIETLLNAYRYHKCNRTHYPSLFLHLLTQLMTYCNKQNTNNRKNHKFSLLKGEVYILLGNAYFELNDYSKAEQNYLSSLDEAIVSVRSLLDDIEKLKINVDSKIVKIQISKLISQIIISLDLQSIINQQIEHYNRCIEINQVSHLFNKILIYFNTCKELQQHLDNKTNEIKDNYKDYVQENTEICKLLSLIFQIPFKQYPININSTFNFEQLTQTDQYQHKLFEKYEYSKNNTTFFIKNKELPPKPKNQTSQSILENAGLTQQYFIRNQSMKNFKLKHNNSQQSIEQSSTNYNDSQIQNKNDQSSLSQIDTSNISKIKFGQTPKMAHRQSFLSELIHLRNQGVKTDKSVVQETDVEKNHRQQKELLQKINNKNFYQPLDQVVHTYINENLTSHQKCQSLEEVKQNARIICQAEAEVHKEVPITKSLLYARRMTCPQGVLVKDQNAENEFNKLLEFNVIEYFDFVQTNKDQAVISLKAQQENQQVRIAQQNLFSENFIPKKKLNFIENEEIKQLEQAQVIAQQAENLLKKTQDKRKSTSKQSRLSILSLMSEKTFKKQESICVPITQEQVMEKARNSIKHVISLNEKQKEVFEEQDQFLKEAELPYKFKRSISGKHKSKQECKSILIKQEFGQLCQSTKNIREKDFNILNNNNNNNEQKLKGIISLEKIK